MLFEIMWVNEKNGKRTDNRWEAAQILPVGRKYVRKIGKDD
jgi:hypothetical protein